MDKEKGQLINIEKGGFFIRLLASLTDSTLLVTIPLLFLWLSNLGGKGIRDLVITSGWFVILFVLLSHIISVLYLSLTTSYFGGTIGKLIAGLMVVDEKGDKLTISRSIFRHLIGYMVSGLLFGLGFLWIIRDPNKQGWHDQLSSSYVIIRRRGGVILVLLTLASLLALNVYMVIQIATSLFNNQVIKNEIQNIQNSYENIKNQELTPASPSSPRETGLGGPTLAPENIEELVSPYP